MEDQIRSLLEPIAEELGVAILKVSLGGGGHSQLLRVIVDKAGGVDSDALERISRGLALQLDAEDLIKTAYRLEVTSPGLDYPFESRADFERHSGEWIKVHFIEGTTVEGRNLGPLDGEDAFTLEIEGKRPGDARQQVISLGEVTKVVRAINWKDVSRMKK